MTRERNGHTSFPLRVILAKRSFHVTYVVKARGSAASLRRLCEQCLGGYLSFCGWLSSREALFVDSGRRPVLDAHKAMAGRDVLGHQSRFRSKAGWFAIVVIPNLCPGSLERFEGLTLKKLFLSSGSWANVEMFDEKKN